MTEQLLAAPISTDHGGFRPIHYLGNKSRVLSSIETCITSVTSSGSTVCDLFAGSGVVSRKLSMSGPVVSSDIQEYSRVLVSALTRPVAYRVPVVDAVIGQARQRELATSARVSALLRFERQAMSADCDSGTDLADLIEFGPLTLPPAATGSLARARRAATAALSNDEDHTMLRHYGGAYFSYAQAVALDALAESIGEIPDGERDTAIAALLSTASEVVSTVGNHFAQPIRPRSSTGDLKSNWLSVVVRKRQLSVVDRFQDWLGRYAALEPSKFPCWASAEDFRRTLSRLDAGVSAVYADPPYTRDHYSRFYHVLETIALGDEPGMTMTKVADRSQVSRGVYRQERHQSPFCISSQVTPAFEALFQGVRRLGIPLVLSYSPSTSATRARARPRLYGVPELVSLAKRYFHTVSVESAGPVSHSKFNKTSVNSAIDRNAEVLIVASP